MKYSIVTFGCRVNQADSFEIEEQLAAAGAERTSAESAHVVVINTCSVTATSDQGARQTIRRIARSNPTARIVVTGCYATREPDQLSCLPGVVRLVVNPQKDRVAPIALTELRKFQPASPFLPVTSAERFGSGEGACGAVIEPGIGGRTAFTLKVQTGCDEPCTYCIIPTTRGPGRSRPIGEVISELHRIVEAGFREVALTGVHLGSYGRDFDSAVRLELGELLRKLDDEGLDVRFRISSLEPMDCTEAIVDLVARSGRFAQHFHLPLQHASNEVLRAMRRPYRLDRYRRLVDGIRERMPHAAIGSDVIVGFPGETDADFKVLADYLADSPLTYLHVFPYSDRPGTVASSLPGKIHGAVIRDRAGHVRSIAKTLSNQFKCSQMGAVHRGLTVDDGSTVITGNYLKLRIPPGRMRNQWVDVKVTGTGETMTGELVSHEE